MAFFVQTLRPPNGARWLWQWLTDELAPYPGRAILVARMVASATLVMIISMTFRLPYAPYAALFALNVSRPCPPGLEPRFANDRSAGRRCERSAEY